MIDIKKILGNGLAEGFIEAVEHTIEKDIIGKGFNFDEMKTKNSAGLQNIQSRVNYLNGKMDIQSVTGKGTSVYIECDLNQNG